MTSAFERVALARGIEAPTVRRANLRVVPAADTTAPAESNAHRPVRFAEIVGQPKLLMRLETHLRAAVARGGQPGHILLDGGPGLGKTMLAQAITGELKALGVEARCHELTADTISSPRKLAMELAVLSAGDVFLVDEIQALKPLVQTALLRVLSDGVMFVEATSKHPAERFDVPAFTLVGATTHPGKLSDALRSRFKFSGHLDPYSFDDLTLVTLSYSERIGVKIEFEAAELIAKASRYTPRRAERLVDAVRDYAFEVTGDSDAPIDMETAEQGLEYQDIDRFGLEERDRRYLRCLIHDYNGGPIGAPVLSASLGMDLTELTNDVEPYLLTSGLLTRRPNGRCATKASYTVLGIPVPPIISGWMR